MEIQVPGVHGTNGQQARIEVQVSRKHGTNGQHTTTTAGERREIHNHHQRHLVAAASTTAETNKWKVEAVATTCRQQQSHNGFEIYAQLCVRFSIPLGTRSIVYLTKLLKPTFGMKHFEATFSKYGQAFLDSVKIAVIRNETTGPLQQHLQLLAGQSPTHGTVRATIMEYYRATPAFNKREQLPS